MYPTRWTERSLMTERARSLQPPTGAQECSHEWSDAALSIAEPVDLALPNIFSTPPKGETEHAATPRVTISDLIRTPHAALLCCIIALLGSTVRGDQPTPTPNAALLYWPALYHLTHALNEAADTDLATIYLGGVGDEVPTAKNFVASAVEYVDALIDASKGNSCDWGIDLSQGPMLLMPHLGPMRQGACLLRADARLKGEAGDHAGAAGDLAAILRMARHVAAGDAPLISALVELSIFSLAEDEAQYWLDRGLFDVPDKSALRNALAPFEGSDPFGVRASIAADRDMYVEWLRRSYQPGQPLTPRMREFVYIHRSNDLERANAKSLQILIERGEPIEPHLILLTGFYGAALAAWGGSNPYDDLENLAKQTKAGKYGPLAILTMSDFASNRATHDKAVANLALLRKRLSH